jgi:hypothetical protein
MYRADGVRAGFLDEIFRSESTSTRALLTKSLEAAAKYSHAVCAVGNIVTIRLERKWLRRGVAGIRWRGL